MNAFTLAGPAVESGARQDVARLGDVGASGSGTEPSNNGKGRNVQ